VRLYRMDGSSFESDRYGRYTQKPPPDPTTKVLLVLWIGLVSACAWYSWLQIMTDKVVE